MASGGDCAGFRDKTIEFAVLEAVGCETSEMPRMFGMVYYSKSPGRQKPKS